MALFEQTFQVQGTALFPVDMLRYDGCHPATEIDAHEIERSHNVEKSSLVPIKITLVRWTQQGQWMPTEERWKSQGWRVLPLSINARRKVGI